MQNKLLPSGMDSPLSPAHAVRVQHQPALPSNMDSPLSRANAAAAHPTPPAQPAPQPAPQPTHLPLAAPSAPLLRATLPALPALSPLVSANRVAARPRLRR
jgi:hypothetical protein